MTRRSVTANAQHWRSKPTAWEQATAIPNDFGKLVESIEPLG